MHSNTEDALRAYFKKPLNLNKFIGYTKEELDNELNKSLAEEQRLASFSILSSIEAHFKLDFYQRVYMRTKDSVSRVFREIHKQKGNLISLEDDLLDTWKSQDNEYKTIIQDLKGAFKYRHWLAHGRFWTPKFGRRYDYFGIYDLAIEALNAIPLIAKNK